MPAFTRTPTRAKFYMWAVLLGAFFAPFGIIQYQLSVQRPLCSAYSLPVTDACLDRSIASQEEAGQYSIYPFPFVAPS